MKRSRLSRQLEKRTKKSIYLTFFGIIIILFLLYKFILPVFINLSLFLADIKAGRETQNKDKEYVSPPFLDAQVSATNSAKISISGSGTYKDTIDLYINDEQVETIKVEKDNTFIFEDVSLKEGINEIKVQAERDRQKSPFSDILNITYKSKEPTLEVSSPSDNQSFSKDEKSIEVKGKTDPGSKVTVNDFWAIVDANGNFSYTLNLKDGENKIKIISVDEAGNKKEKELKVTYSP